MGIFLQANSLNPSARYYGTPVQDLVELAAIVKEERFDKQVRLVEDTQDWYQYDDQASSGDVQPDDSDGTGVGVGNGWWLKVGVFGDVVGPGTSTNLAIARYDGTTGKLLKDSPVTVSDAGAVNIPAGQTYNINGTPLAVGDITGAAASGANSDITSLAGLTTALSVAQGGTGLQTVAAGSFLKGAGTSALVPRTAGEMKTDLGFMTDLVDDATPQAGGTLDMDGNYIQFTPGMSVPAYGEGRFYYDNVNKTFAFYNDESASSLQIGQEIWLRAKNAEGAQIDNGEVVYISGESGGLPEVMLAQADAKSTAIATIAVATHDVAIGAIGLFTRTGTVRGLDTSTPSFSAGDRLYLSATIPGAITNVEPTSPNWSVFLGNAVVIDLTVGTIEVELDVRGNTADTIKFYNGAILEDHDIDVTSNGTVVTLSLEKAGGGDLSLIYNGEFTNFTAAPATVSLTLGTDTDPILNYVFIPQSTNTLTANTTGFPTTQHTPIATVLVQTAVGVQNDGAYKVHAWTDHLSNGNDQGHLSHVNRWMRAQHASWQSGSEATPTGGVNTYDIATDAGIVLQVHEHTMPAFDTSTGSDLFIINDSATAFKKVGDLTQEINTSLGVSMSGKHYNQVLIGVVSEDTGDCKLMINQPDDFYNTAAGAIADLDKTANYNIPADFKGTAYLIARISVTNSGGAGGTFTIIQTEDLRGQTPSTFAGGTAATKNEFSDAVFRIFNSADPTKEVDFDLSGLTTATTRTVTMQDADGTMAYLSDIQWDRFTGTPNYVLPATAADDIGATAARITKIWAVDLEVTNSIVADITGTATNLSGTPALPDGTTATTQSASDNSTKIATTAYVDAAAGGGAASSEIFITPFELTSNTSAAFTGFGSNEWGIELTNSATDDVWGHFQIPTGFTGISSIEVTFDTRFVDAGNGVLAAKFYATSSAGNDSSDTDAATTYAFTAGATDKAQDITINASTYAGLTLDEHATVQIQIERLGADGSDTLNSSILVRGIKVVFS